MRQRGPTRAAVFLAALSWAVAAGAQAPRIIDVADLGVPASRTAHGLTLAGARLRYDRASIGALTRTIAGAGIEPGGELRLALKGSRTERVSLLLTFATGPADYRKRQSWRLLVDGKQICAVDDADPGGGFWRSYVVDLPGPSAAPAVRLISDRASQCRVTLASVRAYVGLARSALPPALLRPMGIAPLSPHGSGYTLTAPQAAALRRLTPASPYLRQQAAVLFNFCSRDAAGNAAEIERLAAVAEQASVPLRIAFQVHWGGTPKGVPDGAGGTYTDLPYQQVTFDPANTVEPPGLRALMGDRYHPGFGLSVPNRWSDTPWLTYNHPRLNQFRRVRLTRALAAWQLARDRLAARGKAHLLPPELSTGEETVYWARGVDDSAYTTANGGKPRADLTADFNPFAASDAMREGVVLDPRDGLSRRERNWLHTNLARQQQRIVDWMFTALSPEPIRIGGPQGGYAGDLVRRNIYTEPYAMPVFPLAAVTHDHPGIEVGYVLDGRSGGEYWSGSVMAPWLLKQRETGRTALPNLECTGADDAQLVACLQAAYATGARFATLYNWHHRSTTAKLLQEFAASIVRPAGAEWRPGARPALAAPPPRTWTAGPGAFGINAVEVWAAAPKPGSSVNVELTVGPTDGSAPPRRISFRAPVPIGDAPAPLAILLPTLACVAPGEPVRLRAWVDGRGVLAASQDGILAARACADVARERLRSVTIQDWRDAADIMASLNAIHRYTAQSIHARLALKRAQELLSQWRPGEAYAAAIKAEQVSLPAPFRVPAPGARLDPYWITIECPRGPVHATIRAYADQAASVLVRSDVKQTVRLRWGNRQTQAALTPGVPAEVAIVLEKPVPASATSRAAVRPPARTAGRARPGTLRSRVPRVLPGAGAIKRGGRP